MVRFPVFPGSQVIPGSIIPQISLFQQQFQLSFPLYTDPSRKSYDWIGFKRHLGASFGLLKRAIHAKKAGHSQGKVQGDTLQQGGEALFDTNGRLLWSYTSSGPGDHATEMAVLSAVQRHTKN